jgi:hypothetical protein
MKLSVKQHEIFSRCEKRCYTGAWRWCGDAKCEFFRDMLGAYNTLGVHAGMVTLELEATHAR